MNGSVRGSFVKLLTLGGTQFAYGFALQLESVSAVFRADGVRWEIAVLAMSEDNGMAKALPDALRIPGLVPVRFGVKLPVSPR